VEPRSHGIGRRARLAGVATQRRRADAQEIAEQLIAENLPRRAPLPARKRRGFDGIIQGGPASTPGLAVAGSRGVCECASDAGLLKLVDDAVVQRDVDPDPGGQIEAHPLHPRQHAEDRGQHVLLSDIRHDGHDLESTHDPNGIRSASTR
jgi:hypothetical protein